MVYPMPHGEGYYALWAQDILQSPRDLLFGNEVIRRKFPRIGGLV